MLISGRAHASRIVLLGALAAGSLAPLTAHAQSTHQALAEQMFQDGQALMKESRFVEACTKFAESQRLDPGTGTLLNLGVCYEKADLLASAWATYQEVLVAARRDQRPDRAKYAEERIAALAPLLPRIELVWRGAAPAPKNLKIELDQAEMSSAVLGVATPIDRGSHRLTLSAPGKKSWSKTIEIPAGGATTQVELPGLEDAPVTSTASSSSTRERDDPGKSWRIGAYTAGALGLVGLGIGTAFGISAMQSNDASKEDCDDENRCLPDGAAARRSAIAAGDASTIAFLAGGVLLGAGVVLYLVAPSAPNERPVALRVRSGSDGARLELGGVF